MRNRALDNNLDKRLHAHTPALVVAAHHAFMVLLRSTFRFILLLTIANHKRLQL
jgi:adenosine/AMP kinase